MPTRFYLPSSGAAAVTPANDSWSRTTGASSAIAMVRVRSGTSMTTITNTNTGVTGNTVLLRQFVSEPLPYSFTLSGNVQINMKCVESASAANDTPAFSIRVCSNDGSTIRSPAALAITASDSTDATMWEMPTTAGSRYFANTSENRYLALSSVSVTATDRIVLEVGYRNGSTTSTRTGGVICGDDSATDLVGTGVTATNNPWIEFESDMFLLTGTGYFS